MQEIIKVSAKELKKNLSNIHLITFSISSFGKIIIRNIFIIKLFDNNIL